MMTLATLAVFFCVEVHGDLHEQIEAVTKQIEKDPADALLYFKRGELYRFHEDFKASLADLKRAALLAPKLDGVDLATGRTWLQAGDAREARVALDRFLARHPDVADALVERARALVRLGERAAAVEDYTRALAKTSEPRPETYIERAQALAAQGPDRLDEALRGLDEGMRKLGPAVSLQLLAIDFEVSARRYEAALGRVDRATAAAERKDSWLARRGDILKLAGRTKEARSAFTAALAEIESLNPYRRKAKATMELESRLRAELEAPHEGR